MNRVDYNKEVIRLAAWLDAHASPYALAYLLAQRQLRPALLNGQNTMTMRQSGLALQRDVRTAEAVSEARGAARRQRRARRRAEAEIAAAFGRPVRKKGIAP